MGRHILRISLGCAPVNPQTNCSNQDSFWEECPLHSPKGSKDIWLWTFTESLNGSLSYLSLSFSAGVTAAQGLQNVLLQVLLWLGKGGWQALGQGTAGGQRCSTEGRSGGGGGPQGKLGAAASGQPSSPLAHLESLSSSTINPWWARELFLLLLMGDRHYRTTQGARGHFLTKAWIRRLSCHNFLIWDPEAKAGFGFQPLYSKLEGLE